ncbi:hypothetical protein NEPTK9_001354 [Candidatus Neptunochlamydia vexilliferae]|uniref:Uncharacterized protein n=1 Tax=Candidatus Neptunichlamydia vexilliferae TaxID=1651774 RepID=A0ABS0B0V7_9BACT|nr:hypothetical protein [Candidatus Neptunochlamydia vexilliferae]
MKDTSGASPRRIFLTYTTDKCANFLPVKVNKAAKKILLLVLFIFIIKALAGENQN